MHIRAFDALYSRCDATFKLNWCLGAPPPGRRVALALLVEVAPAGLRAEEVLGDRGAHVPREYVNQREQENH